MTCFLSRLTFSSSLSSSFTFELLCNRRFCVSFFLSDVTDDAVFLAFSLPSLDSAVKAFIFANFNCCHSFIHLLLLQTTKILAQQKVFVNYKNQLFFKSIIGLSFVISVFLSIMCFIFVKVVKIYVHVVNASKFLFKFSFNKPI